MDMSGQPNTLAAIPPEDKAAVPVEWKAGWAPEAYGAL